MVLGLGAMSLMGEDFNTALFVGAALTATSVGITARVFGDLRALATHEARVVLGAAVADDVMGLVVLTVVVRLVTEGSVSALSVAEIVSVAVLFLVLGGILGLRVAPALFSAIDRVSRSAGTLVALALAFTLAFAELADMAKLAPIIGAFLAGLALNKAEQGDRVRRELTPIGHVLIPVFFLQIGVDVDIAAFGRAEVLRDAAVLLVVAVVGKLLSPLGAIGSPGDKPLIGLGMLPRGEVGLIFATIGLQTGVLGDDLYAALLLVVLVTTLVTPPLLKVRYQRLRADSRPPIVPLDTPPPDGGWLRVSRDEVDLAARPPDGLVVPIAFDAAIPLARRRPSEALLDWLADADIEHGALHPRADLEAARRDRARQRAIVALPRDLRRARRRPPGAGGGASPPGRRGHLARRRPHPQPAGDRTAPDARWRRSARAGGAGARARRPPAARGLPHRVAGGRSRPGAGGTRDAPPARPRTRRTATAILDHVHDRNLLWSAVHQPGALSEERVLELAAHLDTPERARTLYLLSALRREGRERWEVQRLRALYELVQATLADDTLTGGEARSLAERRRADAAALVGDQPGALERLAAAPRAYVLRTPTTALANQARLLDPQAGELAAGQRRPGGRRRLVDRRRLAGRAGSPRRPSRRCSPTTSSWSMTGCSPPGPTARCSTRSTCRWARGPMPPSWPRTSRRRPTGPMESMPLPDAEVSFDSAASPWHTVCEVRCTDRPGLLHALATSFAAARVEVKSANVSAHDGLVIDRFEVTDQDGAKLSPEEVDRVRDLVRTGAIARRRRFGRRLSVRVPG